MKPHKRNGKAAKSRRQKAAALRRDANDAMMRRYVEYVQTHNQLPKISEFYDEVTEDHVTINGATMYAGVDY